MISLIVSAIARERGAERAREVRQLSIACMSTEELGEYAKESPREGASVSETRQVVPHSKYFAAIFAGQGVPMGSNWVP